MATSSNNNRTPLPTVDIIIELSDGGIVLIDRKNEPHGWALPGGFVDYGESLENAAIREAKEETGLDVKITCQMHAYSEPTRDLRHHTMTVVFVATAYGEPHGGDDASFASTFTEETLPDNLCFDHAAILRDYFRWKREGWSVFGLE